MTRSLFRNSPGVRRSVPLALLIAALSILAGCDRPDANAYQPPPPPQVTVAPPIQGPVTAFLEFTGNVQSIRTVKLRARVEGYLEKVLYNEGDVVNLAATASDPEAQGLTYAWTQVSGPAVTLSGSSTATPSFTAPEGLDMSPVAPGTSAADSRKVDPSAVGGTLLRNNRLRVR